MKKLTMSLLVIAGMSGTMQAGRDERDKWDGAIEQSDLASVKKLLRRFEGQEATPDQKKKTLKELVGSANDGVDKFANMSVFGNRWDVLRLASGSVLGGIGLFGAYLFWPEYNEDRGTRTGSLRLTAFGFTLTAAGMYLAFKGLRCTTQQARLREAKKIETMLEDKLASLDSPVDKDAQPAK